MGCKIGITNSSAPSDFLLPCYVNEYGKYLRWVNGNTQLQVQLLIMFNFIMTITQNNFIMTIAQYWQKALLRVLVTSYFAALGYILISVKFIW